MVCFKLPRRSNELAAIELENGEQNTQGKTGETVSVGDIVGIAKAVGKHKQKQANSTRSTACAPLMRVLRV